MNATEPLTPEEISLLRAVDTPTVCNVIELFDVRPRNAGYMDGRIQCCFPDLPPIVGYAATATFRADAPPRKGDAYGSMEKQLEAFPEIPGPPIVVFQDLDDPSVAATFGEVMCSTYKAFGAAGIITSGGGRDLDQVRALGFPAFTGGTVSSHGYCHILAIHVPVRVGGLTVYPGDLLHADRNGVTTIPHEIANAVARTLKDFLAAEDEVLHYVKGQSPTIAGFKKARQRMQERIEALAEKVQRRKKK